MKWRDFMVNWLKRSIEGVRSKGCWLVLCFSGVLQPLWVTEMTLGVKAFKGWCLFVFFQNAICVSQGCLLTGRIVGSLQLQSVFKLGVLHRNSHCRQEGMTPSCRHQHLFLPNPKETDSIMLLEGKDHSLLSLFLFPVRVKERFTKSRVGPQTRDKKETRKFPIVPAVLVRGADVFIKVL